MKTDAENGQGLLERIVLNLQVSFREKRMIITIVLLKDVFVALRLQMLGFAAVLSRCD